MVTVVQLHPQSAAAALGPLAEGLGAEERALVLRALEFAEPLYAGQRLSSQEVVLVRAAISTALTWALLRRAGTSPWGNNRRMLLLRGFLGELDEPAALLEKVLVIETTIDDLNPRFTAT